MFTYSKATTKIKGSHITNKDEFVLFDVLFDISHSVICVHTQSKSVEKLERENFSNSSKGNDDTAKRKEKDTSSLSKNETARKVRNESEFETIQSKSVLKHANGKSKLPLSKHEVTFDFFLQYSLTTTTKYYHKSGCLFIDLAFTCVLYVHCTHIERVLSIWTAA